MTTVEERIRLIGDLAARRDALLMSYPLDTDALRKLMEDAEANDCPAIAASLRGRLGYYAPRKEAGFPLIYRSYRGNSKAISPTCRKKMLESRPNK